MGHQHAAMMRKAETAPSTISIWNATAPLPQEIGLTKNESADICVVGGGIAGLTVAYLLLREGKSVVILEKNKIGRGETSHTSAHLSNEMDATYVEIERMHGRKGAKLAAQSHGAAISLIESIVEEEHIDCDFERVDGYLFAGGKDSENELREEFQAAERAGVKVTQLKDFPFGLRLGPCLQFPQQAQFHPLRYLAGLAQAIIRLGGKIYSGAEAGEFKNAKSKSEVKTKNGYRVVSETLVIATNSPVNDLVKIHTKQAAYRTYIVGMPVKGSIPKALYWDTEDPFHYARLVKVRDGEGTHECLIVGGEDHKTGQDDDSEERYARLQAWAQNIFPGLGKPEWRWSGQIMDTVDGLGFIGKNPGQDNVYIATGDCGMGLTHGTIAGVLIRDLIVGRENPWESLYDPSRKTVRSAITFAKENLNVAGQYSKWITPGEVNSIDEIPPGSGGILRKGLTKFAVYRDDVGAVHQLSAVCSHLGCIVAWNSTERSWDCPCHGSRFDPSGKVLNGPAVDPLQVVSDEPASKA